MSAILGVFGAGTPSSDEPTIRHMLARMGRRGMDRVEIRRTSTGALAVARADWESAAGFSGDTLVTESRQILLAADATLYYRDELQRSLTALDAATGTATPGESILAAYRAWGEGCVDRLEGDFTFILWDRRTNYVLCARDFGGKRPLYYADLGDTLIVASGVGAILAHPHCPQDLDLTAVAATASGLFTALGTDTCYRAIKVLPSGATMTWQPEAGIRVKRDWLPRPHPAPTTLAFDEAAEELRFLLGRAVRERLAPSGTTAVWMSGGWDSTAVFAAGQDALRADGRTHALRPVSISYPPDDPGHEDQLIAMVADRWNAPVHWLRSTQIPLFDRLIERAANRDQPAAHLYEVWNEALARGGRDCGARVALDGNGGDQLFQVSNVYLSDLLIRGRWITLAREWRTRRDSDWREFLRWTLLPVLPDPLLKVVQRLRYGRQLRTYLQRPIPTWIREGVVSKDELRERERADLPAPGLSSRADAEALWYLQSCVSGLGISYIAEFALNVGVELRSPLYDRRIVEFALSRPISERASVAQTKHLLRRSMHKLLPPQVLAPRPRRTGVTYGYSRMWMRERYPALFGELFQQPLVLEELGIVDSTTLERSLAAFLNRGGEFQRVNLFHTLQTELWLRTHVRRPVGGMEPATQPT